MKEHTRLSNGCRGSKTGMTHQEMELTAIRCNPSGRTFESHSDKIEVTCEGRISEPVNAHQAIFDTHENKDSGEYKDKSQQKDVKKSKGNAGDFKEDETFCNEDRPFCYVCFDDWITSRSNPLVSACACRGDTRWLHLGCLERMLTGSIDCTKPCVVFRNKNHDLVCKVCRSEYCKFVRLIDDNVRNYGDGGLGGKGSAEVAKPKIKTMHSQVESIYFERGHLCESDEVAKRYTDIMECSFPQRRGNAAAAGAGPILSIPQPKPLPPYISFKVVTHNAHSVTQEPIFNSTFTISFAQIVESSNEGTNVKQMPSHMRGKFQSKECGSLLQPSAPFPLIIGRSHAADMQLNYQTVSGRHAALHLKDGRFLLEDLKSSNGTFLYIRKPLPLHIGETVRVRMGRKTLKITSQLMTGNGKDCPSMVGFSNAREAHNNENDVRDDNLTEIAEAEPIISTAAPLELLEGLMSPLQGSY